MVGGQTLVAGADGVDGRHFEGVHGEGWKIRHIVTCLRGLRSDGDNLKKLMLLVAIAFKQFLESGQGKFMQLHMSIWLWFSINTKFYNVYLWKMTKNCLFSTLKSEFYTFTEY